jgi:large subunit ribosomal protein L10
VTEYRGLSMTQLTNLRRSLESDTTYRVAKNTLVSRAARGAGVEGLDELFIGPTAIALVHGEPVRTAKALRDFAREHAALVIKGGYLDGRPLTVAEVTQIADLEGSRRQGLPDLSPGTAFSGRSGLKATRKPRSAR